MLRTAETSLQKNALQDRVSLAEGDATAFDLARMFSTPAADRIFISYALSMIPDWPQAIDCAIRQLAPGGALLIVDFCRMGRMPGAPRWAFRRFLKHYNVTPRHDLETVARAAADRHGLSLRFEHSPREYSCYAIMKRHARA